MEKRQYYHHSVTELGNLQLRIVTEYVKDGKVTNEKRSNPVTPADVNNMGDWDDKSKDIVNAIIDSKVLADFEEEKQEKTGEGIEEIVTYDRVIDLDGKIAVRRITRVFDEGKEVDKKFHRTWINPGDNSDNADVMSKAVAKKLHTQDAITKYKNKQKHNG